MRRAKRLLIVASAACVLVACNLIAGFESEYTVANDSGTTGETSNPDGPNPDGSTDGPVGNDGSPDTSTDGGIDAKLFSCADEDAGSLGFCEDFEGSLGASFGFDSVEDTAPDASFSVVPGPRSKVLRIVMPNPSGAANIRSLVKAVVGGNANPRTYVHFEAAFDFHVPAFSLDYSALGILTFPAGGADREHGISIELGKNLGRLQPQDQTINNDVDAWFHCFLTMDREVSGTTYKRKIVITNTKNGASVVADDSPGLSSPTGGGTEMRVGAFNTSPDMGSITVEFDNVVVRRW